MEHNRVCCLYRVSTEKQVDYDNNHEADIPMQRKACHRFAEQMGWQIVHEEQEDGVSGHKVRAENRDKIQAIKELARKGAFDILLVFMFDRIGRIADETPFVVEWFVKNGIQVWSTQEGEQRFDNHIDKLLNYIRFWQADGESEKTSIRTRTSLGQLVEDGHYKGGNAPIGYELVRSGRMNKKKHELYDLKIKEEDASTVRRIFEKYVLEGYGVQKIANDLNGEGIRNPTGNRWSYNTIRNILLNPTYTGILRSGDSRSPRLPELQIISQEMFDRAQKIREERRTSKPDTPRVPINMRGNSLLSGNVFCGHCGSRLHLTTTTKRYTRKDGSQVNERRLRYCCYQKVRKMVECDGQSGYSVKMVDGMVEEIIKKMFSSIKGIPKSQVITSRYKKEVTLRKNTLAKLQSEATKARDTIQKLREEVVRAIQGESSFPKQMLADLVAEAEAKAADLQSQCQDAERALADSEQLLEDVGRKYTEIMSWADMFDTASMPAKKMIVNAMIHRVDVCRGFQLNIELNMDIRQFFAGIDEGKETGS